MENQGRVVGTNASDSESTLVRVPISRVPTVDDLLLDDTLPRLTATIAATPDGAVANEPSVFNRAFKGLLVQSVGRFYGYAIIALGLYLRLRTLSQNSYGDYGIVFVYLSFFSVLADAGVMYITIREASKHPELLEKIVSTTLVLKIFFAVLAYGAGIGIGFLMPYSNEVKIAIAFAGVSMALINISGAFDVVFQSRLSFGYPTAALFALNNIIFIGTLLLFLRAQFTPGGAENQILLFALMVATNVIANVAQTVIYWLGGLRQVRLNLRIDWAYCRSLLALSIPMGVIGILGQVHVKADSILLSVLKDPSTFAVYNVAYRVIEIISIFFSVFANTVFPVLARASEQGASRYTQVLQRILNISVTLSIPIAIGDALLAPEIVALLGGKNYPQAALPLAILSFSLISSLFQMVFSYVIIVQNRQRNLIWVYIINIIANVGLNLYAIPRYSYNGSAVATVITETLGMLLVIVVVNRYQRALPSFGLLGRIIIASVVMAGGVLALRFLLPPYIAHLNATLAAAVAAAVYAGIGAALYVGVLYLLGGVDPAITAQIVRRIPLLKRRAS